MPTDNHPSSERCKADPRPYGAGRLTPQRRAIARAAAGLTEAFSVEKLHDEISRDHPEIGLATVYRAIAAMTATGFVERVGQYERGALYVWCPRNEHHHHLVCTDCGAIAHAECPLDERRLRAARDDGFTVTSHEVMLYGLCAACSQDLGGEP